MNSYKGLIYLYFWILVSACQEIKYEIPLSPNEQYLLDRFGPGTERIIQQKQALFKSARAQMNSRSPQFDGEWTLQGPANIEVAYQVWPFIRKIKI